MTRAVAVTGVGVVSALGVGAGDEFDAFLAGGSAIVESPAPEYAKYAPQLEARVTGFDRATTISSRMLRKLLAPSPAFAVGAAGEAIADAGLTGDAEVLARAGIYLGSLSLEVDPDVFIPPLRASLTRDGEFELSLFAKRGMKLLDPLFLVRALPNAGLMGISLEHQVLGPNTNITNGPTSGLGAVTLAASSIARGEIECAIAGGYDSLLVMDAIAEHLIAGRLTRNGRAPERACRPFDRTRDGYALGEGAAFVVLESLEHAEGRGARPYARVLAHCSTADPGLLVDTDPIDGTALEQAARGALARAGAQPADVAAVFGDGLATQVDDLRESGVVGRLVNGTKVPFSAPTGALGYTGAVSGVFSLVHASLALRRGIAPPLACSDPDPRCPVHLLSEPAPLSGDTVLVWNSERGVKNVALVATRAE